MGRSTNELGQHITQRGGRLFATLVIPKDVQGTIGRTRFIKALETDSPATARRRTPALVAQWKAEIGAARARMTGEFNADIAWWRRAFAAVEDPKERDDLFSRFADASLHYGEDDETYSKFIVEGQQVATDAKLEEWIAILPNEAKTKDLKRQDIKRLAKRFPTLREITKRDITRFLQGQATEQGLAPATIARALSSYRGYWTWLQSMEVVDENRQPFAGVTVPSNGKASRNSASAKRRPFEPKDVVGLYREARRKADGELADIIDMARWTGARIEELAALTVELVNLKEGYLDIDQSKSAAGIRQVPIHANLKPTLKRLIGNRESGYVMKGLTENKYGDRSNAIGKRFGRLKTGLGFGPEYVFHSLRKTVITMLERKGVEEGVVADIVGHEKQTITYGLYSDGTSLAQRAEAIAELEYPNFKQV